MRRNNKRFKVIAIIPAYNEEGKVGNVVKKTIPYVDRILVIDDGSSDNTYNEVKNSGAVVIKHMENMGVGAAIRSGVKYALKNNFDICVPLSGDDQDNPKEIQKLAGYISKGYDFVQGSRYVPGAKIVDMPLFRKITTRLFSIFFSLMVWHNISDASNGFKAFKTSIINDKRINLGQDWLSRYELEPYLLYKAIKLNYKFIEAPVTKKYSKIKGYTKMKPIIDWWRITKPLVYLRIGIKK